MQLTSFTDYALRVLIFAAVRSESRCLTTDAATAFGISRHHVVKVVNELRHLGYPTQPADAMAGLRSPDRRTASGSARSSDGPKYHDVGGVLQPDTNTCPLSRACGLKGLLREAFDAFLAVLDRATLADLIAEPRWITQVVALHPRSTRDDMRKAVS